MLCDHMTWRTHGRSLKIEDLKDVLQINRIDDDHKLADIIYRIKTVIGLIFGGSTIYKLFYLDDLKLAKTFSVAPSGKPPVPIPAILPPHAPHIAIDSIELEVQCPQCGKKHEVSGYLDLSSQDVQKLKLKTNPHVHDNDILVCDNCNFALDLKPIKSQVETQTRRKVIFK